MESKFQEWITLLTRRRFNNADQDRRTSEIYTANISLQELLDIQEHPETYNKQYKWNVIKAFLDRHYFSNARLSTTGQPNVVDPINKARDEVLALRDNGNYDKDVYRIALKILLETGDYNTFLHQIEKEPAIQSLTERRVAPQRIIISKLTDNRTEWRNRTNAEKSYIYYAIRGHVVTKNHIPERVIAYCEQLDGQPNSVWRTLMMFSIYGPPPRSNQILTQELSEVKRLELLLRLRRYYGPIPTNGAIFVDESKCEITCKLGVFDKLTVSTCRDPEEFRYVVRMFFQLRPVPDLVFMS